MIDTRANQIGQRPVIALEGLGVRLGGRPILRDLDVSLSGRALGLLGPNGAGKTTLIHTLLGFHPPSEGTAHVLGLDIRDRSAAKAIRREIGYMPERDAFIGDASAVRQVRMMGEISGLPSAVALERAHEALINVGLGEARYRPVGTYSLGMKQRVKLAQAIVHGPRLLFLDEPTNGLDPAARIRMIKLIRDIRDSGVTIVLSSHLLHDVEATCEDVLILKDGALAVHCDLAAERRSNQRFLEVEVRGDVEIFAASIGELGCDVAVTSRRGVKIIMPGDLPIRALYEIAAEQQMQIRRLSHRRDSLHDIFLRAMGVPIATVGEAFEVAPSSANGGGAGVGVAAEIESDVEFEADSKVETGDPVRGEA